MWSNTVFACLTESIMNGAKVTLFPNKEFIYRDEQAAGVLIVHETVDGRRTELGEDELGFLLFRLLEFTWGVEVASWQRMHVDDSRRQFTRWSAKGDDGIWLA